MPTQFPIYRQPEALASGGRPKYRLALEDLDGSGGQGSRSAFGTKSAISFLRCPNAAKACHGGRASSPLSRRGRCSISSARMAVRAVQSRGLAPGAITVQKEATMNWDVLKGKWEQFAGHFKSKWGKLTDDDWTF